MRAARLGGAILAGLLVFELCLRVYHPLPFRTRGDRIILPRGQSFTFENPGSRKLDRLVRYRTNSIGFRGPDPPPDWNRRLTLLTIGGSTTACVYLADGQTWTDRLAVRLAATRPDIWINNAGLDGQSTFGHLVLLRDVVVALRPRMALFLIGTNDVERSDATGFDAALTPGRSGGAHRLVTFLADHSELAAMAENLARAARAHRAGFGHSEVDLRAVRHVSFDDSAIQAVLARHRRDYLDGYRRRVAEIVATSRSHRIEPVLITQPALFGETVDPATGVDLRDVQVNGRGNGALEWRLLELYNDVTRDVANATHSLLIDLAREMPKDSRYYYDFLHFTKEGAALVGDLVSRDLGRWIPFRNE
jgi:lysophospholipase L1-like esterase